MKPNIGKVMHTREEPGMAIHRIGVHTAIEKRPPKAEDTKSTVSSTGKLLLKTGTTKSNDFRKFGQRQDCVDRCKIHKALEGEL